MSARVQLTCHKCNHKWDDEVSQGQGVVQCPECMVIVPLSLAAQGQSQAKASAPKPEPPKAASPKVTAPAKASPSPRPAPRPISREEPRIKPKLSPVAASMDETKTAIPQREKSASPSRTLTCHKCGHTWEGEVGAGQGAVLCPECATFVPMKLAQLARPSSAPKPSPSPRPASRRGMEERETIVPPLEKTRLEVPEKTRIETPERTRIETPAKTRIERSEKTRPEPTGKTRLLPREKGANQPAPAVARRTRDEDEDLSDTKTAVPPTGRMADEEADDESKTRIERAEPTAEGGSLAGPGEPGYAEEKTKGDLSGMTVDGYEVAKKLGEGGMGMVYLARQISLDRKVALKVLPTRMANNPEFLIRFTREALSAAQLGHHNIIQVYDVGRDQNVHYISMEFVPGKNLGDMVREDGKLDLETAAGYVLQAARGLKYAHDRGIVHRDIKPDNLMVNDQGLVKIADMGLAKMRGAEEKAPAPSGGREATIMRQAKGDLTQLDIAMGTPAYMPPEQARDAAGVDHRADQYSLGCTLYYLCAGKTPFSGGSAMEIISKHIADAPPPLEKHIRRVPAALNAILTKTMAKEPKERYAGMTEVIRDLEAFLGVESEKGPYTPREQHVETLEVEELAYYSSPALKRRKAAIAGFFGGMAALVIGLAAMGQLLFAGGVLGLFVLTPLINFIMDGLKRKTFLFRRVRAVFFGMTLKGWAWTFSLSALTLGMLWLFRAVGIYWLGAAVVAFLFSLLYQRFVMKPLLAQRAGPLERIEQMLKQLRIKGVSEDALQDFLYRFSGERWEELFEDLFGYGPMLLARIKWGAADKIKPRKRYATWRDPIARWLDDVEESRKRRKEKKELARVEAERLKAKGIDEKTAKKRAEEMAVQTLTETILKPTMILASDATQKEKSRAAKKSGARPQASPLAKLMLPLLQIVRFFGGVGICAAWGLKAAGVFEVPIPVAGVSDVLFSHAGLATGILLALSAFSRGAFMSNLVLAGAVLMLGQTAIVGLVNQSQFDLATVQYTAWGMMGIGLAMCFLDKISGGEF